jgi:hypothetical protein
VIECNNFWWRITVGPKMKAKFKIIPKKYKELKLKGN